jgi:hypothetical protein
VKPAAQSAAEARPGELLLHLTARYLRKQGDDYVPIQGEGGDWTALPGEDWIRLDREQQAKLLPPVGAKAGADWEIDRRGLPGFRDAGSAPGPGPGAGDGDGRVRRGSGRDAVRGRGPDREPLTEERISIGKELRHSLRKARRGGNPSATTRPTVRRPVPRLRGTEAKGRRSS